MKKSFFIVAIAAMVICNLYFLDVGKDTLQISLSSIVNLAQAQTEGPEDWYTIQVCYRCVPLPQQTGAIWECWWFFGDPSLGESCIDQGCSYGYCY